MKIEWIEESPEDRKAEANAWKHVRERGLLRFLIRRGILQNGLWFAAFAVLFIAGTYWAAADPLQHPWLFAALFAGFLVVIALRFVLAAYEEWRHNERNYISWKEYENGGKMLSIDD
jgi:hypothetical protein